MTNRKRPALSNCFSIISLVYQDVRANQIEWKLPSKQNSFSSTRPPDGAYTTSTAANVTKGKYFRRQRFENCAPLSAVTKLRREEWQIVIIRKQKEKSEGENELPRIVSSY